MSENIIRLKNDIELTEWEDGSISLSKIDQNEVSECGDSILHFIQIEKKDIPKLIEELQKLI